MRFAVIGDIHSNIFALESVLKDIEARKVDFIVSTGDLVGYLPFPNEVIDTIKQNKILVVQGNHDKHIANSEAVEDDKINKMSGEEIQKNASAVYTNWIITNDNRKYLKNLSQKINIQCNGFKVLVVHGSPRVIDEYLYESEDTLTEIAKSIDEDIIVCGHTHIPYHVVVEKKHFINAGSVGKPKHGEPLATYVIIDIIDKEVKSEIIKVSYDVEKIVRAIEDNKMISNKLILMLKEGF
ncbi:metallophosphoesterase [Clostridium sp. DJ247]|uniref:metallophosphoesterase family protein n=1 Tax=Clostridium sp. DJ247 TaxID=2726188 RepID=UPI0016274070|nr:metallophosphoesterase family protein [Clostridium sp. DJ247]MBC2579037.1 metallophosphoesterase family protein [Clostridium sp. DJ247]